MLVISARVNVCGPDVAITPPPPRVSTTSVGSTSWVASIGGSIAASWSASTTSARWMVIDNISSISETNPGRSVVSNAAAIDRRSAPNPAVTSAVSGIVTMLPPWPAGSSVITTNDASRPASSVTAIAAFAVDGNSTRGRTSIPTASPSCEFDSVTTPTVNIAPATPSRSTAITAPTMVRRVRRPAIAVTPVLRRDPATG